MTMYKVLTIAGSDTSGGAGIQADLKTMQERDVYGLTAITTIVAQDPHNSWYHAVYPIDLNAFEAQLETVLAGVGVHAAKTGMLGSVDVIKIAAEKIKKYNVKNLVVDPVMVCKGADEPVTPEVDAALREYIVPLALVVTPNLFEASQLANMPPITTIEQMKEAAKKIHDLGAQYVIIKGGSKIGLDHAVDVLYDGEHIELLESEKIDTTFTHGAGCTFSAAITAEIAKGAPVREAILFAKDFITQAIRHSFRLNQYVGPVRHSGYRIFGSGQTE